jgi:hypothetical protein
VVARAEKAPAKRQASPVRAALLSALICRAAGGFHRNETVPVETVHAAFPLTRTGQIRPPCLDIKILSAVSRSARLFSSLANSTSRLSCTSPCSYRGNWVALHIRATIPCWSSAFPLACRHWRNQRLPAERQSSLRRPANLLKSPTPTTRRRPPLQHQQEDSQDAKGKKHVVATEEAAGRRGGPGIAEGRAGQGESSPF